MESNLRIELDSCGVPSPPPPSKTLLPAEIGRIVPPLTVVVPLCDEPDPGLSIGCKGLLLLLLLALDPYMDGALEVSVVEEEEEDEESSSAKEFNPGSAEAFMVLLDAM
jgi:hypothetical protein